MAAFIILFALLAISICSFISYDSFIRTYENYPLEVLEAEKIAVIKEDKSIDLLDALFALFVPVVSKIGQKVKVESFAIKVLFTAKIDQFKQLYINAVNRIKFNFYTYLIIKTQFN